MARPRSSGRRDVLWVDTFLFMEHTGIADSKSTGSMSATVNPSALGRATVIRIRGSWWGLLDPAAAQDVAEYGIGILKASTDAITAGVASFPGPISDPDADWMWVHYDIFASGDATAQDGSVNNQSKGGTLDTKAMRRFGTNENLIVVAEAVSRGGTPPMLGGLVARVLIQEG